MSKLTSPQGREKSAQALLPALLPIFHFVARQKGTLFSLIAESKRLIVHDILHSA